MTCAKRLMPGWVISNVGRLSGGAAAKNETFRRYRHDNVWSLDLGWKVIEVQSWRHRRCELKSRKLKNWTCG
jgi:hypothetical protein